MTTPESSADLSHDESSLPSDWLFRQMQATKAVLLAYHLEEAAKIIAEWPEWKVRILGGLTPASPMGCDRETKRRQFHEECFHVGCQQSPTRIVSHDHTTCCSCEEHFADAREFVGVPAPTAATELPAFVPAFPGDDELQKLREFKRLTHATLDAIGVPACEAAPCRIAARLDIVSAWRNRCEETDVSSLRQRLAAAERERDEQTFRVNRQFEINNELRQLLAAAEAKLAEARREVSERNLTDDERLRQERDDWKRLAVDCGTILEALRAAEFDGTALCDTIKAAIVGATDELRAALTAAVTPTTGG